MAEASNSNVPGFNNSAAIIAALNNTSNIDTGENEIDPNNNTNQQGLCSKLFSSLTNLALCQAYIPSFAFYYLIVNIILFFVTVTGSPQNTIWWTAFLIAVVINITFSIASLVMNFIYNKSSSGGPDPEMGIPSASGAPPTEDKSESFKTILTINSKTANPTVKAPIDIPGVGSGFVNLTPAAEMAASKQSEAASKTALVAASKTSPSETKAEKKERHEKEKEKEKREHEKKKQKAKKDKKEKEAKKVEKEANYAFVPSNVLVKSAKKDDKKEDKAKKKKGKANNNNKKKK